VRGGRKSGGEPPHSKKGDFAGLKAAATKAESEDPGDADPAALCVLAVILSVAKDRSSM
jgi:hypothetical protein